MTQSRTSSSAVKERFMVVRPWGNEYVPSQQTHILYDLGVSSPPRAMNSEASARGRGQGELSLSSSWHKRSSCHKRGHPSDRPPSHGILIIPARSLYKRDLRLSPYVAVVPAHVHRRPWAGADPGRVPSIWSHQLALTYPTTAFTCCPPEARTAQRTDWLAHLFLADDPTYLLCSCREPGSCP